ncbi:PREDICTED: uncharacterized protein C3orf67-like [Nanorana parkeri]|uniref:uncharacterized protein C3orf67-like n=1 Tax=Nanorana parkeri TaxID=125878 RepID=UPI000854244A|nr:PREDICTED: uncharacterized protein C3orf67-like [Nanorana parkeri]
MDGLWGGSGPSWCLSESSWCADWGGSSTGEEYCERREVTLSVVLLRGCRLWAVDLDDTRELFAPIENYPTANQPLSDTTLKDMLVSLRSSLNSDMQALVHQFSSDLQEVGERVTHIEDKMGDFADTFNELVDAHNDREDDITWLQTKVADLEDRHEEAKGIPQLERRDREVSSHCCRTKDREADIFKWTSSPKTDQNLSELYESSHPVDIHSRSSEDPSLLHSPIKASSSNNSSTDAKIGDFSSQRQLIPTRSLSPSGSRNESSKGNSVLSKIQQFVSDNKLRTSMSKKSLKEIPKEDRRMTDEASCYDWRNYNVNRLSASEMQMLASLKRQQNEELEDEVMSHGLSQSQIDHCNVSMSTSSDDTATWNSCLPPPVNQGSHYQAEMNPLAQSNPRDWLNAFSPPIIPTSQNLDPLLKLKQSSQSCCNEGDDGICADAEEDILTLLYDPCLNCYFDPESGKYYELA